MAKEHVDFHACCCVCLVAGVLVLVALALAHPRRRRSKNAETMQHLQAPAFGSSGERSADCELRPGGHCWLASGQVGACSRDGMHCVGA